MTFAAGFLLVALGAADGGESYSMVAKPLELLNVTEQEGAYFLTHLTDEMNRQGVRVVGNAEITALLGLERQRQLFGCAVNAASECLAELGGALGAPGLLTGSVGRFGDTYQLHLKVLATNGSGLKARFDSDAYGERALMRKLSEAARVLVAQVLERPLPPLPIEAAPVERRASASRRLSWIPFVVAGAAGAGGGFFALSSFGNYRELSNQEATLATLSPARALSLREQGERQQSMALVFGGVAAAGALTGTLMYALGEPAPPAVALVPGPGGVSLCFGGAFP